MREFNLGREGAGRDASVWAKIDDVVTGVAKSQLSARKMLFVEGPYGLGLKNLPWSDHEIKNKNSEGVRMMSSGTTAVVELQADFTLSARDIATSIEQGMPLESSSIASAAMAIAKKEDDFLFNGDKEIGSAGLLNAKGTQNFKLKPWNEVGQAAEDVIKAVTLLDDAGFHGPYTLGLSPKLYNLLFRAYMNGAHTEMHHIQSFITDGIVKLPAIKAGGVLLASGKEYASIALGQDMLTGFVGPSGRNFDFVISESLALRLVQPAAICILQ